MKTAIGSMNSQKRIGRRLVCSIDWIMPHLVPGESGSFVAGGERQVTSPPLVSSVVMPRRARATASGFVERRRASVPLIWPVL